MTTPYEEGVPQTAQLTAYYFGGAYEVTGNNVKKYYSFGGQTILRDSTGLQYFLTDHLGSVVAITNAVGTLTSQQRYLPFGQARTDVGSITQTDFGYTGQRNLDSDIGLMDYRARYYSSALGRFVQPDSLIPGLETPQTLNRYSYVNNNPINFNDPSGHCEVTGEDDSDNCHVQSKKLPKSTGGGKSYGDGLIGPPLTMAVYNLDLISDRNLENFVLPNNPTVNLRGSDDVVWIRNERRLSLANIRWADLTVDSIGLTGDLFGMTAPFFPAGATLQKASNVIEGISVAYDVYKFGETGDSQAVTIDYLLFLAKQSKAERLVPFVGAGVNAYSIKENWDQAIVEIAVTRPKSFSIYAQPIMGPRFSGPTLFEPYMNP